MEAREVGELTKHRNQDFSLSAGPFLLPLAEYQGDVIFHAI